MKKEKVRTLYLLRHRNIPEYTKIGITNDIDKRIKSLQTASPTGLEVVYTINTRFAEILERHLHTKYNRKQSNLEWFRLSPVEVLDIIHYVETLISEKGNQ